MPNVYKPKHSTAHDESPIRCELRHRVHVRRRNDPSVRGYVRVVLFRHLRPQRVLLLRRRVLHAAVRPAAPARWASPRRDACSPEGVHSRHDHSDSARDNVHQVGRSDEQRLSDDGPRNPLRRPPHAQAVQGVLRRMGGPHALRGCSTKKQFYWRHAICLAWQAEKNARCSSR